MGKQAINILKQYVETGDYPTQQQLHNWLESYRHLDESIPIEEVEGLVELINSKADAATIALYLPGIIGPGVSQLVVPAGTMIEKFLFIDAAALNVRIGITVGGNEYVDDFAIDAGGGIVSSDRYFANETTIYFTGITVNTIIKIYKR